MPATMQRDSQSYGARHGRATPINPKLKAPDDTEATTGTVTTQQPRPVEDLRPEGGSEFKRLVIREARVREATAEEVGVRI